MSEVERWLLPATAAPRWMKRAQAPCVERKPGTYEIRPSTGTVRPADQNLRGFVVPLDGVDDVPESDPGWSRCAFFVGGPEARFLAATGTERGEECSFGGTSAS